MARATARFDTFSIWTFVALAMLVRIVVWFILPARSVNMYEFGIIGENLAIGRGYSYFSVVGGQIVTAVTGTPLPSAFMPPAYTFLVAGAFVVAHWFGGDQLAAIVLVRVLNLVLAAAMVALVVQLGRLVHSDRAGRFAALACGVYPPLVYQSTQISASNLYIPLELLLLVLTVRAVRTPRWSGYAAAGAALGVVCLVRAEAVLLVAPLTVWLAVWGRDGTAHGWRRYQPKLIALFVVIAMIIPGTWLLRTSVALQSPTATVATTGGFNLWIGNNPGASGSQKAGTPESAQILAAQQALPPLPDYEVRRDAIYRQIAVSYILDHPGEAVARDVKKLAMLLTIDIHDPRSTNIGYVAGYVALVVAGLAGFVAWRRGPATSPVPRRVVGSLLAIYLAVNIAIPTVFFTIARSKLPLEMMLIVMAGVLGATLTATAERRRIPADDSAARPVEHSEAPAERS